MSRRVKYAPGGMQFNEHWTMSRLEGGGNASPYLGDWELFDTVVVGAEGPVDTMEVTGLMGEAHVEYLVRYLIIKENVGTSNDVQIRLNGATTNRQSRLLQTTTLYSQASNKIANHGTAATYTAGEFHVSAAVNPHGSSVDWPKIYYGFGGQGSGSGVGTIAHAGGQDDDTTALASIKIVATDALSDTLNADIAEGSVMEVWQRVVI